MSIPLRHDTDSQNIILGPFVDNTDGFTQESGLTINSGDILIWKHGATSLVPKTSGGATYITGSHGLYYTTLSNSDVDTLGGLEVHVYISGALPVKKEFNVLLSNVFDSLVDGSDYLWTDTIQMSGQNVQAYETVPLDPTGIREAIGLSAANLDTQLADVPTVAEFEARTLPSGSYGSLNATDIRTAIGMGSANLDTQLADISGSASYSAGLMAEMITGTTPNRQFTSLALENAPLGSGGSGGSGDWTSTEKSQIRYMLGIDGTKTVPSSGPSGIYLSDVRYVNGVEASGTGTVSVDAAEIRSAIGLASANLDTQLGDIPTVTEFNARTLPSGDYSDVNVVSMDSGVVTTIQSGLSTLDAAGIRTAVGLASANLDTQIGALPTTGDLTARTIVASGYATQAELDKVIKTGESRTLTRAGKTDVTYVDTRD